VLRRAARTLLVPPVTAAVLAGCGFIGASSVSHIKPNGFVLRGQVTVPAAGNGPGVEGTPCVSALSDIAAGVIVKVSDVEGHELGRGQLAGGVLVTTPGHSGTSCDFPFQITAVPGGVKQYAVSVAGRPAKIFGANELHENQQAVIVLTQDAATS
jgi:hypothetical protein